MQHIFLDFEMNPIPRSNTEARAVVLSEIIQIGAVRLDEEYRLVDRFSLNVRPELNQVQPNITALTGITQADVEEAPLLAGALTQFAAWIGQGPVRVYSWSDTDRKQLFRECRLKELEVPRPFRRWMDFQRVYTRLLGLSRRSPLSLKNALGASDTDFEGSQHSAVADAENSASLLALVKDKEAFQERTKVVLEVMGKTQEPTGTTLGDLFGDFGSIRQRKPSVKKNGKKKKR